MLEIARFWGLKTIYNEKIDRYEIDGIYFSESFFLHLMPSIGVMGPDEFHEKYPESERAGLKNNAYTNVMVAWLLDKSLCVLQQLLPEARRIEMINRLHLTQHELDRWEHITRRMVVPFLSANPGVIAQFEGWDKLLVTSCTCNFLYHAYPSIAQELDWEDYKKRYGQINRMDRILKSEGDSPDRYKVCKQADTCMLFFLLSEPDLLQVGLAFMKRPISSYPYFPL